MDGDLYNETTRARDMCIAFSVCAIFNPLREVMYQRKHNYLIQKETFTEIESLSLDFSDKVKQSEDAEMDQNLPSLGVVQCYSKIGFPLILSVSKISFL